MSKKKTTTEKYIEKAVKAATKELSGSIITGCDFTAVRWDVKAVDAVQIIAEGLICNAKGLIALAEVLKSSNVHIDTLLEIKGGS